MDERKSLDTSSVNGRGSCEHRVVRKGSRLGTTPGGYVCTGCGETYFRQSRTRGKEFK